VFRSVDVDEALLTVAPGDLDEQDAGVGPRPWLSS
jgi:hypothetical protein